MVKFFRNIRQKLLKEGKFFNYLKYAIGEILLVVIGILIALQVNNWNELAKKKELETIILEEIKENLVETNYNLIINIEREQRWLGYNLLIMNYIDNKKPYNTELDLAFGSYYWSIFTTPITVGYEYLKQSGFNLISNNELRKNISNLVEVKIIGITKNNERWAEHMESYISKPYHVSNFRKYFPEEPNPFGDEHAKPNDYDALIENEEFKNINAEIISTRKWNINSLKILQKELTEIIEQIDQEIQDLK